MILYTIVTGLTALLGLGLGLFVYFHKPRTPLKTSWVIFSFTVGLWSLGYFISLAATDYQIAITASRLSHASGAYIPITFLHFVLILLHKEAANKKLLKAGYVLGTILFFSCFSPLVVRDVLPKMGIRHYPDWGPLYTVYAAMYAGFIVYAHLLMVRASKVTKGLEQRRIIYLFTASLLGFSGGISLFLLIFNIPIPPYGSVLICLYPIIMSYSIVKHKLMDIEVIIKKTLVFAGIVAAAVSVIAFPLALIQAVIGKAFGVPDPFILMALGIATTVLIYRPVERFLVNVTDKYLFQKKINYRLLLREASEYLAHVDSLKQQARNIVAFLLKKARIASASVYAFAAPDKSSLLLKASRPFISDDQLQRISLSHPLIEYFSKHQGPVEINALEEAREDNARSHGLDEILALMKSLQAEAAIPCFGGEAASKYDKKSSRLKGVLFLGHQKSDEPYSEEDLDVFFTLGQESSIAFENARLYDEAINRSLELQKMNEELSKTQKELIVSLSDVEQANVRLKETHAALLEEKKRAVLAGLGKSMAHEIRNPITPINSHLYFGRKRLQEMKNVYEANLSKPSKANNQKFLTNFNSAMEMLSEIEKSKDRIQGIVNTLYNLVAQKTGNKVEVKLDMVAESAIEEVKYQNYWETLSQPDIKNRIPRQLPFVLGIPQDIQGVFVNLIINALHAMEKTVDKRIIIDAMIDQDNPDMIKIEFTDNGCGIPEELQEKIFEHGFTTKGGKGTGLGLFYCKNIIEQVHGGTIGVKSQVGNGTCFTIRLPRFKKEDEKRRP